MALLPGREEVRALLGEEELIDLIIPRGSNEFVQYIMHNTKIPVMGHADGICHVYVDASADLDKAVQIAVDAKTQYVAVCNAAETLLVHSGIAPAFLQRAVPALLDRDVELRGDERALALANANGQVKPATESDWSTEYLDLMLAVKVVDSTAEAIEHINAYGSHHTDAIVTEDFGGCAHLFARGGFSLSDSQCFDALCRWLQIRAGGRGRHQHQPPAQPRPGRPRGPRHLQVHSPRGRPHRRYVRRPAAAPLHPSPPRPTLAGLT